MPEASSSSSSGPFKYERIAAHITSLIDSGALMPGDRIPSIRRMSRTQGVSVPTVLRAYQLLEARRLVRARPQAGFYVRRRERSAGETTGPSPALPPLAPSPVTTADLIARLLEVVADSTLAPLGTALPDPGLLPTGHLTRFLGRAVRREGQRSAALFSPAGIEELRTQIVKRVLDAGGITSARDVVVTGGCTEALSLCLRAVTARREVVAVESPAYFGTLQILDDLGLRALEIPMDPRAGISVEALEVALNRGGVAAVVVTPTVHNPLGCVMPDERKRRLVELAAAHDVPVIEDDTYGELHFETERSRSLSSFDESGIVLSCGSFSKTLAPGYRIGWTIPGRYLGAVLHLKRASSAASSVPPQLALAEYLADGRFDPYLRRLRRTFQSNVDRLRGEILDRFPEGTRVSRPAGGFLLWVQLPDGVDAVELQRRGREHGIGVAPGPAFSASGMYTDCIRVNAGYVWTERIGEELDRLAALCCGTLAALP